MELKSTSSLCNIIYFASVSRAHVKMLVCLFKTKLSTTMKSHRSISTGPLTLVVVRGGQRNPAVCLRSWSRWFPDSPIFLHLLGLCSIAVSHCMDKYWEHLIGFIWAFWLVSLCHLVPSPPQRCDSQHSSSTSVFCFSGQNLVIQTLDKLLLLMASLQNFMID